MDDALRLNHFIYGRHQVSTELAKTLPETAPTSGQEIIALIPEAQLAEIERLDRTVRAAAVTIAKASPVVRAFVQAKAILAIKGCITPAIMADLKQLMDTPLGFKTDRKPGAKKYNKTTNQMEPVPPYHDNTLKECFVVALLGGATIDGNEFNILVGQTYFTKEFMQRKVLTWPGLTDFELSISPPMKHGDKTAACSAKATWKINGEPKALEFFKTDAVDLRIVVNAHDTSGTDQLIGMAESKVLRRVVKTLTGMNFGVFSDTDTAVGVDESKPVIVDQDETHVIEHESDDGSDQFWRAVKDEIAALDSINAVTKLVSDRVAMIKEAKWTDDRKSEVENFINELSELHKSEIRERRGK